MHALKTISLLVALTGFAAVAPSVAFGADTSQCLQALDDGQEHRARGRLIAARAQLLVCAADGCPAPVRKDCAKWLTEVEADLPTVVIGARDGAGKDLTDFQVLVDNEPVSQESAGRSVTLDPGPHTFRFEHAGDAPVEEQIVLRMGERNRAVLAHFPVAIGPVLPAPAPVVPAPPAPEPLRPSPPVLAYVLTGIGAVGVGAFSYLAITGYQEKQDLLSSCAAACSDAEIDRVRHRYVAADVSLAIGVVSLAVATYLFLAPRSAARPVVVPVAYQPLARSIWK